MNTTYFQYYLQDHFRFENVIPDLINGFGGLCVLGSYAHGLITNPLIRGELWGGIPDSLRIYYTVFMFLAAGG